MVHDDLVVINVRVLDTLSGLNVPGSSLNASGPRRGLLSVAHKLAHQLHRKLTGEDLILEEDAPAPLRYRSSVSENPLRSFRKSWTR